MDAFMEVALTSGISMKRSADRMNEALSRGALFATGMIQLIDPADRSSSEMNALLSFIAAFVDEMDAFVSRKAAFVDERDPLVYRLTRARVEIIGLPSEMNGLLNGRNALRGFQTSTGGRSAKVPLGKRTVPFTFQQRHAGNRK
jgi:hypothetical protein